MADCSAAWRDDFCFGLLRPEAEVPDARVVAAAAAAAEEDFEADLPVECLDTAPVLESDDLRGGGGFAPEGSGFFLGGAIV